MKITVIFVALMLVLSGCTNGDTLIKNEENQMEFREENIVNTEPTATATDSNLDEIIIEEDQSDCKAVGFDYDEESLTYELVWSDEFDYEGLPDNKKWSYDVGGHGWGNRELQHYTEGENVEVKDGNLIITARKEDHKGNDYTSTRLVSKNKGDWLYGKIEVRAKLPSGRGTWPAIWMLPTDYAYGGWPRSGEIDIMEHVGYNHGHVHGTIHTEAYNLMKGTQIGKSITRDDATDAFYKYSIEWLPDKIKFMIDDKVYFIYKPSNLINCPTSKEWPFDKHFHLILNIAVGGFWGGAKGVDDTIFPQQMVIDYVRVYQAEEFAEIQ